MNKHKKELVKKLRKDIEYKVSAEKKAFEMIVELVGEEVITEERLIESLPLLNPINYSDIIEERFSMKLCSYILCANQLKSIPRNKYHISVKTRQVFDLSERKKFCCDQCYKASNFFASQLNTEPLWKRSGAFIPEIKFLQINSGISKPHDVGEKEVICIEDKVTSALKEEDKLSENVKPKIVRFVENPETCHDFSHNLFDPQELTPPNKPIPPLEECCSIVSAWLTNRTLNFLIKDIDTRDFFDGIPIFPKLTDQLREQLGRKLNTYNSDSDDVVSEDSLSENDEFSAGKYLSKSTIDKMQAIYTEHAKSPIDPSGKLPPINSLDPKSVPKIKEKELEVNDIILPTIDTHSQSQIRTKIVLEKLYKTIPAITQNLRLMPSEIWPDLTCLVKTFRLSQYNISLKPNQWIYMLIILTYLISLVNSKVKSCLENEQILTEFNTPLIEQGEDPTMLKTIALIHP